MKKAGRSPGYVFAIWIRIAVFSGFAALLGYTALEKAPETVLRLLLPLPQAASWPCWPTR